MGIDDSILKPMLAHAGELPESLDDWVLEPKYDGFRLMYYRPKAGASKMFLGRNTVEFAGTPYLTDALDELLPKGTIVDGELISEREVGEDDWGQVATVVKRWQGSGTIHEPSDELPALSFVAFDLLRSDGENIYPNSYDTRRGRLEDYLGKCPSSGGQILLTPNSDATGTAATPEGYYGACLELDYEGVMAKAREGEYVTGAAKPKRAPKKVMVKCKAQHTEDVVVIGKFPAKPDTWLAAEGLPGGLLIADTEGGPESGRVGTGLTRGMRAHIRDNWSDWDNSVIEVGHMTVAKDAEKRRHPSFLRRRPDKTAADC